jgi:glucosamine--fructose-6-phosphate aminotransferase (isomerizing)
VIVSNIISWDTAPSSSMATEAAESAEAVTRLIARQGAHITGIAAELRRTPPAFALHAGRGSSDHAGVYGKYLIEQRLGIVAGAAGLSVGSVYRRPLAMQDAICIAVSQSGRSPDLLAMVDLARQCGARSLALVNDAASPLAARADALVPLEAGPERSVAATKSFVASVAAFALLVAHWSEDEALRLAIEALPDALSDAWQADWSPLVEALADASSLFALGRGAGYAIAREAALKLKETSGLHAEAYSAAEVLHGPAALAGKGYPILAFAQDDASLATTRDTLATLRDRGARVFVAGTGIDGTTMLPGPVVHPLLQPIVQIVGFYKAASILAPARGRDPDRPPHLAKVTETL